MRFFSRLKFSWPASHFPLTLNALRSDDVGGLVCGILHAGAGDAQLLHDAVQQPLDVGLGHLVGCAEAASRSPSEQRAQEQAEER